MPVKVNALQYPYTAKQFGITRWPSEIIMSPDGQIIERLSGGATVEQYLGKLNQIAVAVRNPRVAPPLAQIAGGPAPGAPDRGLAPGADAPRQPATAFDNPPYTGPAGTLPPQSAIVNPGPQPPAVPQDPMTAQPTGLDRGLAGPQAPAPVAPSDAMTRPWPAKAVPAYPADANSSTVAAGAVSGIEKVNVQPTDRNIDRPTDRFAQPQAARRPADNAADRGPVVTTGNPPLALDGYCAVTLTEKERWAKGDPRWGVIHRGRTYLFTGPEEAARFYDDPDRYAPVYSGYDVVMAADQGKQIPGQRQYGVWYDGRMYLFVSQASCQTFDRNPGKYAKMALEVINSAPKRPAGSTPSPSDGGNNLGRGASVSRQSAAIR